MTFEDDCEPDIGVRHTNSCYIIGRDEGISDHSNLGRTCVLSLHRASSRSLLMDFTFASLGHSQIVCQN